MAEAAHRMSSRALGTKIALGLVIALASELIVAPPVAAAPPPPSAVADQQNPALSYADLADLSLPAQVIAGVTVTKANRLKGEMAPGLQPRQARFLVTASVGLLLRGANGLPGVVTYIVDLPLDEKGRLPKLKKQRFLVLAEHVAGRPAELRLNSPYSHLAWAQPAESILRAILTEANSAKTPPRVTGIGNAFYVAGSIPGEGESQIFLTTANNRPISLTVLRRPGEEPQWAVALGEMVDESAQAPAKETLLWYRLACSLPPTLPASAVGSLGESEAEAARADYRFIIGQLGPCTRMLPR